MNARSHRFWDSKKYQSLKAISAKKQNAHGGKHCGICWLHARSVRTRCAPAPPRLWNVLRLDMRALLFWARRVRTCRRHASASLKKTSLQTRVAAYQRAKGKRCFHHRQQTGDAL